MKRQPIPSSRPAGVQTVDRSGATMVEFALVAPIFLTFLFAAFEFGHLCVIRNTANNAVYEAARVAMVPGATAQEAINEANRILGAVGTRSATVTVNPSVLTDTTTQVTVSVSIPFNQNALFTPWFANNLTMTSSSTLEAERYGGI